MNKQDSQRTFLIFGAVVVAAVLVLSLVGIAQYTGLLPAAVLTPPVKKVPVDVNVQAPRGVGVNIFSDPDIGLGRCPPFDIRPFCSGRADPAVPLTLEATGPLDPAASAWHCTAPDPLNPFRKQKISSPGLTIILNPPFLKGTTSRGGVTINPATCNFVTLPSPYQSPPTPAGSGLDQGDGSGTRLGL